MAAVDRPPTLRTEDVEFVARPDAATPGASEREGDVRHGGRVVFAGLDPGRWRVAAVYPSGRLAA